MAKIDNATGAWASITLTADETWQVWEGVWAVDVETVEANRLGLRMVAGDSKVFLAGATVYYRLISGAKGLMARVAA